VSLALRFPIPPATEAWRTSVMRHHVASALMLKWYFASFAGLIKFQRVGKDTNISFVDDPDDV